jgi:hypothetical protein
MLIEDGCQMLAAWREALLGDDDVRQWSWRMIEAIPVEDLPEWLLDLAIQGPSKCTARSASEFIEVPWLDFAFRFSLRVQTTDFTSAAELDHFILWTASACMGEDSDLPEVKFGYRLDHLWHDCSEQDLARALVFDELPRLRENLAPVSPGLVQMILRAKAAR